MWQGPQYTPVTEENGKNSRAADDSEVSPGGESHRYPGDGQGGKGVAHHYHHQGYGAASNTTVLHN